MLGKYVSGYNSLSCMEVAIFNISVENRREIGRVLKRCDSCKSVLFSVYHEKVADLFPFVFVSLTVCIEK